MTKVPPFSVRMSVETRNRLDAHSRRRREPRARIVERLIDEGLRMEEHPGIVFRGGAAGRRAGLAAGPDVWEVLDTLKGTGLAGEEAIAATAEWGGLTAGQVRTAVRYYADHRAEIDEWIEGNGEEAERARLQWERAREALA